MENNQDIHLTQDERNPTVLAIPAETNPGHSSSIPIGSLKTSRPFNAYALHSTLKGTWRVRKGFTFREISSNIFSFQFAEVTEKERIYNSGPWSFDRALLVLQEPGMVQPSKLKFNESPFWIRLYDVPFGARSKETARLLGSSVGEVMEIDESTVKIYGKFIRLRAKIDITKPLRRGIMATVGGKKIWIYSCEIRKIAEFLLHMWYAGSCRHRLRERRGKTISQRIWRLAPGFSF